MTDDPPPVAIHPPVLYGGAFLLGVALEWLMPLGPLLAWPDGLRLTITSSADHWVVYDESEDGVCVEPQTGPPDAVNLGLSPVLEAGGTVTATMTWRWAHAG